MCMQFKRYMRRGLSGVVVALLMSSAFQQVAAEVNLQESQAVVLMYHHFGVDKHPSTNVRLEQFDAHLQHLKQAAYQVWPLEKVVDYLRAKKPFPGRVAVITIDDAYLSVYEQAYPRLRKLGWPFTVFVATDGVDQHFKAYMSWQQMREMQQHGASFENHSATHDYLIRRLPTETADQWRQRMQADIGRAQQRITTELGKAPTLFAYPYGEYDVALANLVKQMGLVGFGQQSGPVGFSADLRALPRFPMAESFAALPDFKQKLKSLAFPINAIQPWGPVVHTKQAPRMQVELGQSDARLDQLSCFVSGQGAVAVEWLDRKARRFAVQAPVALSRGRSRYNCTAPSSQRGRYFWFSHLWIVP
jgi:biofilm PGA synthesis lipoprotein PgaB